MAMPASPSQFIHVDTYSRAGGKTARSARQIAAEAERDPSACPHIPNPEPPVVLFGVAPSVAVAEAEANSSGLKDAAGRKLRADAPILAVGVISLPAERAQDWPGFREASLKWLKKRYGDRLRSVVEHTDEEHPHLHFYVVPGPGEGCQAVHEGYRARVEARQRGDRAGKVLVAYQQAMRALQDAFQAAVGAEFGLARLGPRRQRLTRAAWKAQKAALDAQAKARRELGETVKREVSRGLTAKSKAAEKRGYNKGLKEGREAGSRVGERIDAFLGKIGGSRRRADELADQVEELSGQLAQSKSDVHALEKIADDKQDLWRESALQASSAQAENGRLHEQISDQKREISQLQRRLDEAADAVALVAAMTPGERISLHLKIVTEQQKAEAAEKPDPSQPGDFCPRP
jgi:predicted nuclease with TOPRIM domain